MERIGDQLVPVTVQELGPAPPLPDGIREPIGAVAYRVLYEDSATCTECHQRTRRAHVGYWGGCSCDAFHLIAVCTHCAAVDASALPHPCEILDYMRWSMSRAVANRDFQRILRQPRCRR